MNEIDLAPNLPPRSHADLARHGLAVMCLWDPPLELPADTRRWAEDYAQRQVAAIRDSIFPIHGL
jgi:hypothetical protein